MNLTDEQLEDILRAQTWIEPHANFTERVLERLPALAAAPRRTRWLERALMTLPVVVFLVLLVQNAQTIGFHALHYIQQIGFWLGSTTGFAPFAAYPILVLGIVAPIMAGAVASCALTNRCRISRAITP